MKKLEDFDDYEREQLRSPGKITSVKFERHELGFYTCWVMFSAKDHSQGFGGIAFEDDNQAQSFMRDLLAVFDVKDWRDLTDKECCALRCFPINNEPIEGLEAPSGKRFLLNEWRRKHWPETPDVLTQRKASVESTIEWARRRLRDEIAHREELESLYLSWEEK